MKSMSRTSQAVFAAMAIVAAGGLQGCQDGYGGIDELCLMCCSDDGSCDEGSWFIVYDTSARTLEVGASLGVTAMEGPCSHCAPEAPTEWWATPPGIVSFEPDGRFDAIVTGEAVGEAIISARITLRSGVRVPATIIDGKPVVVIPAPSGS